MTKLSAAGSALPLGSRFTFPTFDLIPRLHFIYHHLFVCINVSDTSLESAETRRRCHIS